MLAIGYLIVAMCCAVALESGRAPRLMRSGIIAGAIALMGWYVIVAMQPPWDRMVNYQRVLIWPTCWAGVMMLMGLLLLPQPHQKWWVVMRRVTFVLLELFAALVAAAFTFYPGPEQSNFEYEEAFGRIGGVLGLLAGGGVVFTFLAAWLPRFSGPVQSVTERRAYWLRCPRCQNEHDAVTGKHVCEECGLRIQVELS